MADSKKPHFAKGSILNIFLPNWAGWQNEVFLSRPFWIFFFEKKIFFCLIPWKIVKGSWIARMGQNFDDYPGFQPFRSWANTYAQDCIFKQNFMCREQKHHCVLIKIEKCLKSIEFKWNFLHLLAPLCAGLGWRLWNCRYAIQHFMAWETSSHSLYIRTVSA